MGKIRVGLIGCGRISDLHYPGYVDNKDAEITAVCDTDEELAGTRQKEWKAEKCYLDYRDLLADPGVDAVEILSPQPLHEEMTIRAAESGKHIALQKPMTIDLASMKRETEVELGYHLPLGKQTGLAAYMIYRHDPDGLVEKTVRGQYGAMMSVSSRF